MGQEDDGKTELLALARAVRAARLEHGWTLDEVARRSGLDVRHVQLLEAGGNPTMTTLLRLSRGLGIAPDALVAALPTMARDGATTDPDRNAEEARRATSRGSAEACAHRVRLLRLQRGWSQPELADRVGLSVTAIQSLEAGKKSPTLRTLDAIAHALAVEPWTLLRPLEAAPPPIRARVRRKRR